jgi:cell pole-organizing protein PopZ
MGEIQHDPSMEEILASIKAVIREDGRPSGQPRAARPRPPRGETVSSSTSGDDDVLELDDPVDADNGLLSTDAAAASRQSLAALSAAREAEGGPLETVIRDMLRPVLKDWLDEHLPRIVEELVTREIARITGRKL